MLTKNKVKKRSKALDSIEWNLLIWCKENSLTLEREYKFHPDRRWRFDFAIHSLNIAIEFEGGVFMKNSGHNTASHYTKDTDKYNAAQQLGWTVLRYTALNYKNLVTDLNMFLKNIL